MQPDLQHVATIELGVLSSRIVRDPVGRRCVAMTIDEREVCLTITQALMVREMLDIALRTMAKVTPVEQETP